ncbi:MAG: class I tRNA ligase family protein, partial [Firmicutes bacterium]|nr:class I tRNA ligase family protein [Bacillota bacterium]
MRAAAENVVLLLSPFAPHVCEEMWEGLGYSESLYRHPWPQCDESALVKDTEEIVIQVNGKVRDRMDVPSGLSRDDLAAYCKDTEAVKNLTEGKQVVKMIAVPGKLFNIVVKG